MAYYEVKSTWISIFFMYLKASNPLQDADVAAVARTSNAPPVNECWRIVTGCLPGNKGLLAYRGHGLEVLLRLRDVFVGEVAD
ncbi:hypothetical protein FHW67_000878 [Herbaspirillum sp. Sphag1AN]|uniref:hypothetical protein n=1 Tax=unclassified Herbaspirillum TaxID=2624150 RepID=UPI0016193BD5|nr:hypothetical protein [Herbaspirillum sp. Sphag1AN]MBB3245102.1 hypothetical protein [Herbaspirillum sp. Sphag64]